MCGIFGFNWEDKRLLIEMGKSISYRGPDQDGYFTHKDVSLGHKRLSIIDLSEKGRQPMFNEEGDICVVFNGEIYNFQDIRPGLEKRGHKFISDSDTEVIIHAYEEYGHDCLKYFNGMFAFAIYDLKKKEIFIARDRLGIKPLYYYFNSGKLIFASEIKAILQHGIDRKINDNCLKQIINYEYPINGETLIQNIYELKPGFFMVVKDKKIRLNRYWELKVNETDKSLDFYVSRLDTLLTDSVKRMLISDVPLGVALSGGIDSSVITAIASKTNPSNINTFTLGFDSEDDEFEKSKLVAEYCKTNHTEIRINNKDYVNALPKVLWHYERPFSKPAIIPSYFITNRIKDKYTVSLTGEGSDELFGGYRRYDAYSELPSEKGNLSEEKYDELVRKISMPFEDKVNYVSSSSFANGKEDYFKKEFLKLKGDSNAINTFGKLIKNKNNLDGSQLNQALKYELETEIPYFHCKKLDKTSMANSHEVRVPYLDHTVVEFAMTIPAKYKFQSYETKIVLRKLAQKLLPKEVTQRKKMPINTPIADYFKKDLIKISENLLSLENIKKNPYYDAHKIGKLIKDIKENNIVKEQTQSSRGNPFRQLLLLTNIELWKKIFIEGDIKRPDLSIERYL
jgi:asparagine synthase (glutamine-hydrolysing)